MARAQAPNSANSQFFIMFEDGHFLNNNYTVWGRVIDGMEHVDNIKRGAGQSGTVRMWSRMYCDGVAVGSLIIGAERCRVRV